MVIIIAPHLKYPLRNGGDIYIDRIACNLSKYKTVVYILSSDLLVKYVNGYRQEESFFKNKMRTKTIAAARTVLFRSHYLLEKFITKPYREKAIELMDEFPESSLIFSFIVSSELNIYNKKAVIITHNNEIEMYRNHQITAINFLQKELAKLSEKWLWNFLSRNKPNYIFAHITEKEKNDFEKLLPNSQNITIQAGVESKEIPLLNPWTGIIRLLFCGSLSVKMNLDALSYFQKIYWPIIKENLGNNVEMVVAGSDPSTKIKKICNSENWSLYPNISDIELNLLYNKCTFGILPFPYTTGAKIKLLNNLSAGLPVIATKNMIFMPDQEFFPNLYSNEPDEWVQHLRKFIKKGTDTSMRTICQKFASQFSWEKIVFEADRELRFFGFY